MKIYKHVNVIDFMSNFGEIHHTAHPTRQQLCTRLMNIRAKVDNTLVSTEHFFNVPRYFLTSQLKKLELGKMKFMQECYIVEKN